MLYVVCYDIVDNRRRRKVSNVLLDFGSRVQKSAFECDLKTAAKRRELLRRVKPLLDTQTDSLRVYRVCAACVEEREVCGIDMTPIRLPVIIL